MTRDEVLRFAEQAEFGTFVELWANALMRFANSVSAAKRDQIYNVCCSECAAAIRAMEEQDE